MQRRQRRHKERERERERDKMKLKQEMNRKESGKCSKRKLYAPRTNESQTHWHLRREGINSRSLPID